MTRPMRWRACSTRAEKFDTGLLQHFIRCLGVYPRQRRATQQRRHRPGGERESGKLLQPTLMLYDPTVPKKKR